MNQFLLVAINAKYIHSNLAVYSLKAYAEARGVKTEFAEYTINHQIEDVLIDLYEKKPAQIGFSCYIWNMDFVKELAEEFHKVMPQVPIWLGGPEVSWNPQERLREMPFITGIMLGEGEQTFAELADYYVKHVKQESQGVDCLESETDDSPQLPECEMKKAETDSPQLLESGMEKAEMGKQRIDDISGLYFRKENGQLCRTASRSILDLDELIFPYKDLTEYANRIIYYESSRGCPFSCSYCLSSVEKKLRFRSLPLVYEELEIFLRERVAQVKFVDRTFNCRHEHAYGIWKYILEHDNGVTNFHFEIAADLLREEDFELFARMRPGLIQLEIGVQSTNPDTIRAIGRKMDLKKVSIYTERIRRGHNIHQHLDLIAGLPYENLESFIRSFNDVYAMKPDQLQLGFLKVLHGTRMERETGKYDLVYRSHPAYEVLSTKWLSFQDLILLKNVEAVVEDYYNSGQFASILSYVLPFFQNPFSFYWKFGEYLYQNGYRSVSQNRIGRYMALRSFLEKVVEDIDLELADELLSLDYCLREKLNRVPPFIPDQEPYKKMISDFFAKEMHEGIWLGEEAKKYSYRQLRGRFQPLVFQRNVRAFMNKEDTDIEKPSKEDINIGKASKEDAEIGKASKEEVNIRKAGKEDGDMENAGMENTEETQNCGKIKTVSWLALFDYEKRNVMDHNAEVIWIRLDSCL